MRSQSLFECARECLLAATPEVKCALTAEAVQKFQVGQIALDDGAFDGPVDRPGRPQRPVLVSPRNLPRRRLSTVVGRAAFLHALTHIEFNAINLAWDAVHRFPGMPADYYHDWVRVAGEEARHFQLLRDRLQQLEYDYGDFDAHDGLWQMALETRHDPLHRMALVPRVLEARGLDVTPGMIDRLEAARDPASANILRVILCDEIGHVEIGTRWYRHLCRRRGLNSETLFPKLLDHYLKGQLKAPFNYSAREHAGFTAHELSCLEALAVASR